MADIKIEVKSVESLEKAVVGKDVNERCPVISEKIDGVRRLCGGMKKSLSGIDCRTRMRKVFSVKTLKNKLPILKWLPQYRLEDLRGDLIAGFTLGLTVIPQSMAYARIAELPTQYGLYTSFMCYFVYCFMGTARDVNIGPAAVMSLLTAEFTHQIPQLAALLSLICGLIQLIMGFLNIGFIMEFISHTIINSFTTAAALAILFSQVKRWLGLEGVPRDFVRQLYYTVVKIHETKVYDCILGFVCMLVLYALKKIKTLNSVKTSSPFVTGSLQFISTARNAIAIFLTSMVAAIFYHNDLQPFTLTGNITAGLPPFEAPKLSVKLSENVTLSGSETMKMIGIGSVIAPLVGLIEVIAIAKAFGKKNGYKVDSTQEFISLGVSNILGSFVSAYPVTGSFSRSAVASQSGIRTTGANVVTGILVLLALAFLTPIFFFIPTSGLAAVIIMAVLDLIDFSMIWQLWRINKADLVPWFVTFFFSLLFGFEYGILIGVAVSLLFLIYPWTKSQIKIQPLEERFADVDNFQPIKAGNNSKVVVVEPTFGLLFPGAEAFEEKIYKQVSSGDCVILDFNHIMRLDFSATNALSHLTKDFAAKNIKYVFINLHENVHKKLMIMQKEDLQKADSLEEAVMLLKKRESEEKKEDNLKKESLNLVVSIDGGVVVLGVGNSSNGGVFKESVKEKQEKKLIQIGKEDNSINKETERKEETATKTIDVSEEGKTLLPK